MDVLGPVEFGEVLMAYPLHEWRGRLMPPSFPFCSGLASEYAASFSAPSRSMASSMIA